MHSCGARGGLLITGGTSNRLRQQHQQVLLWDPNPLTMKVRVRVRVSEMAMISVGVKVRFGSRELGLGLYFISIH
jgi:hypothetical protein